MLNLGIACQVLVSYGTYCMEAFFQCNSVSVVAAQSDSLTLSVVSFCQEPGFHLPPYIERDLFACPYERDEVRRFDFLSVEINCSSHLVQPMQPDGFHKKRKSQKIHIFVTGQNLHIQF